LLRRLRYTEFPCVTSTKVHILTRRKAQADVEHVRREACLMMAEAERKKAAADRLVEELLAQVKEATNAQLAAHPGDAETARDAQRATLAAATEQALAEAQVPTLHAKKKNAIHTKKSCDKAGARTGAGYHSMRAICIWEKKIALKKKNCSSAEEQVHDVCKCTCPQAKRRKCDEVTFEY
jgi:hypothetical protein